MAKCDLRLSFFHFMVKFLSYAIIRTLGANKLFSKWIVVCVSGQILVALSCF